MSILKDMMFAILHPFLKLYIRIRFGSFWVLKEHLKRHPSKLLDLAYQHHFMAMDSYVGINRTLATVPYFPHRCQGVYIADTAVLGKNVIIFQQVTIGGNALIGSKGQGHPVIGDEVYIGAGAKIIGGVTIGDHCRIGANAVVYQDMPPHSVAVCSPTRIIQKENLDNTFYTIIDGQYYATRDGKLVPVDPPQM